MKSDDRVDRLINRTGSLVDLVTAVLFLYVVAVVAVEIGDILGFVKTMREGW